MTLTLSQRIERISVSPDFSILQALKLMDELQVKLLLVINHKQFISVLSIGDIQRAIIKNIPLENSVSSIIRTDVRYAATGTPFEDIKKEMLTYRTECMPVIDDSRQLSTVFFWEDIFGAQKVLLNINLDIPVVVMAGGKGTRLKPITNILPKPLIPIGDRTILEHILDRFRDVGCNNFLMSLNYKAEMIMHYFNTLENNDYHIEYFKEENFLGTAGSLHLLKGRLDKTFFVTNCDIIVDTDYSEIYNYHRTNANDITIVGVVMHYAIPYGVLETEAFGMLTCIQEKPEMTYKVNSGMYILEPAMLEHIPDNRHYHITELIDYVQKAGGRVGVFPVSEGAWMDIGEWSEYNKTAQKMGHSKLFN